MSALDGRPLPPAPPDFAIRFALWLHARLSALVRRLTSPEIQAVEAATGVAWTNALAAIVRADIPDLLAERSLSASELAASAGLDADIVHRSLRTLSIRGIFRMDAEGRFSNSRSSHLFRRGHPGAMREFLLYFASQSNKVSWEAFDWTLKTGESAFEHVHGMTVWEWFDRHDDERETFAAAMTGMTRADAPTVARLYPFDQVRVLCDVGGGRGLMLSEILIRHARLTGILCDAPAVLAAARALLQARGVAGRVGLAPGNFFDAVPGGADAYLLKNILHDWDDDTCLRILRTVRRAAAPGARLLIAETLVPRLSRDPMGTGSDLQMAIACARGRERDESEFHALFERAGFAPGRVFSSPLISVVEGLAPS